MASPSTRICSPSSERDPPDRFRDQLVRSVRHHSVGTGGRARRPATGRKLRGLAERPVSVLAGVGPKVEQELAALGIETILDLITYYPRRYIDGTRLVPIADLAEGDKASVVATVSKVTAPSSGYGRGRRRSPSRVVVEIADGTGRLSVVFFNQTWRVRQLPVGTLVLFFGSIGSYRGALQLTNPTAEVLRSAGDEDGGGDGGQSGRVYPVYPLSEKANLTSAGISGFVREALDRAGAFAEPLSIRTRQQYGLVDRTTAFNGIHRPLAMADRGPARRRLAFDELLRLQLALVLRQNRLQSDARGIRHVVTRDDGLPTLTDRFLERLPFRPTGAQRRALDTIRSDLAADLPMHRLLQGDVGSGKTVVAVGAMLTAVEGGHQAALMAPTEVLAEQHAAGVRALVDGLTVPDPATLEGERPLKVALLTNRTGASERAILHQRAGRRHGRPVDRDPCAAHRSGGVLVARGRGHRRTAPVRGRAAGGAEGQGPRYRWHRPRPRSAGDDGHPHPEDGRHGRLRRPGHDHHRRAARGASAGLDPVAPDATRGRGGLDEDPGRGGRRATGRSWCALSSTGPNGSRPRRRWPRPNAWPARSWTVCGWASSTASCPPLKKSG